MIDSLFLESYIIVLKYILLLAINMTVWFFGLIFSGHSSYNRTKIIFSFKSRNQ